MSLDSRLGELANDLSSSCLALELLKLSKHVLVKVLLRVLLLLQLVLDAIDFLKVSLDHTLDRRHDLIHRLLLSSKLIDHALIDEELQAEPV